MTLYNASNELDNPDCIPLRCLLSKHFDETYGFPLGAISSDLAFHLSGSPFLEVHLSRLLQMPTLWDNICFSIDEQIPMRDCHEYSQYIERCERTWKIVMPALTGQLYHARAERRGSPRLIINMLVPPDGASFRKEHQALYPGGPLRAATFDELADRYIKPFVGSIVDTIPGLPAGHKFTSGIARLSGVPGSAVYVAYNRYAPTGRGPGLVRYKNDVPKARPCAINIKLYPVGQSGFQFRASFTTAPFADDEVGIPAGQEPDWFRTLNERVIETGSEVFRAFIAE